MAVLPALGRFVRRHLSFPKDNGRRVAEGNAAALAAGKLAGLLRTLFAETVLAGKSRRPLSVAGTFFVVAFDAGGGGLDCDFMARLARATTLCVSARRLAFVSWDAPAG